MAARLDLDDVTRSTSGGLHLATMGGLWQALAFGFLGISAASGGGLQISPNSPAEWPEVELRFAFRGSRVAGVAGHDEVLVTAAPPLAVTVRWQQKIVAGQPVMFTLAGAADPGKLLL